MATKSTFITLREAAKQLGVHESTVRRYADRGLVGAIRLPSGVRRLRSADVEALGAATGAARSIRPAKTLAALAAEQGVRPLADAEELAAPNLWRSDAELAGFIAMTRAERDRDR
jgi:excisionase family DNA binding protein